MISDIYYYIDIVTLVAENHLYTDTDPDFATHISDSIVVKAAINSKVVKSHAKWIREWAGIQVENIDKGLTMTIKIVT